ncbi:hypothetical protein Tco_0030640 [Tanacetum coccineum]
MSLKTVDHTFGDPQVALKDTGIFGSGYSRHMTGNKSYLTDYQDFDGGHVASDKSVKHIGKSNEVGTLCTSVTTRGTVSNHYSDRYSSWLGDRMERAATTASSLEAEQDSGSGPRCQHTILGDVNAQTRFEITSIQSIDPPLSRGYTLGSGEDSMKLIGIDEILYTTVI